MNEDWTEKLADAVDKAIDDANEFTVSLGSVVLTWKNQYQDDGVGLKEFMATCSELVNERGATWSDMGNVNHIEYFEPPYNLPRKWKLLEYVDWLLKFHPDFEMDAKTLFVYYYFIRYLNSQDGSDFIVSTTLSVIAEKTRYSTKTIQRAVKELVSLGLLEPVYISHSVHHLSKYKVKGVSYLKAEYGEHVLPRQDTQSTVDTQSVLKG